MSRMSRWKAIAWLGLASILVVAAIELGLRLTGLGPSAVHTVSTDEFERIPGMYSPGQHLTVRQIRELPYQLSTNSLGYRGAEFPLRKPAGESRVLVIGDSYVFGDFVDDRDTLPAQLESALRPHCATLRVINAGLSGSSIDGQIHIATRALAVEPDVVLLVFSENDVAGLAGTPYWEQLARARTAKSRFPMSLLYAAGRDTAIWTALMRARANVRSWARRSPAPAAEPAQDMRQRDTLRARYGAVLGQLRDAMRSQGIPLIATAFPSHLTLRGQASHENVAWFAATSAQHGLEYIDLLGWLAAQAEPRERLYLLPWDGHPSPFGHATAAVHLAHSLLRMEPLNARCNSPSS